MGFRDKFKKEKEPSEKACIESEQVRGPSANTMVCIFFDRPNVGTKEFEKVIVENLGQEALIQVDDSSHAMTNFMLRMEGIEFMCSYMPFPFPKEEADIPKLLNLSQFISVEERDALIKQQSFCLITQIGGGDTLEGKRAVCLLISQLSGLILEIEGAAGVFYNEAYLLMGKKMYLKHVDIIRKEKGNPDYFPSILWVLVYPTRAEDGNPTVETLGLWQFGFPELQFYKPEEELPRSFEKLYLMSIFQITGREVYKNMDTIYFTKDVLSIFKQNGKKLSVIGGI